MFGDTVTVEWDVRVNPVVQGAWRELQVGVVGRGALRAEWGARWGAGWSVGMRRGGELRRLRAVPALAGVHWVCIEWEDSVVEKC